MPLENEKTSLLSRLQAVRDTFGDDASLVKSEHRALLSTTIDQLSAPIRVVIAGPKGSEHGMLAEFLLGTDLFAAPHDIDTCPPIRVRYGREARTLAVSGSSRTEYEGCDIAAAYADATLIDLELPRPILMEIGFLIYPSYDGEERRTHQLFQMIRSADIVAWCSNAKTPWSADELRLWKSIPERQKERSILILTGADFVITDQENQIFEEKCATACEYFDAMVSISVDTARLSAPDGSVIDVDGFAASGGGTLLKTLIAKTSEHEASLIAQAQYLLGELDTIQETEAKRKQTADIRASASEFERLLLDDDGEDEGAYEDGGGPAPEQEGGSDRFIHAPSVSEVKTTLLSHIQACKDVIDHVGVEGYAPLFEEMLKSLNTLNNYMKSGLKLTSEHHQVAIQIREAEELIGLLGYESDERSAQDAADIVKQMTIDFWRRLPIEDEETLELNDIIEDEPTNTQVSVA